jgi:hypothetical protein
MKKRDIQYISFPIEKKNKDEIRIKLNKNLYISVQSIIANSDGELFFSKPKLIIKKNKK